MARAHRSLFGEILDWMLAPLLLLWPASVALTWLVAQGIANRPYDRALAEAVRALSRQVQWAEAPARPGAQERMVITLATRRPETLMHSDEVDQMVFQVLGPRGEFVAGAPALPVPPDDGRPTVVGEMNYRDEELEGERVRVAWMWVPVPPGAQAAAPVIQVAETLGKRSRLATEIIKGVILPQFVILPLAVLLVWMALARGIAPLNELQQRIRRRASDDLSPIEEQDVPEEVGPLVQAINDLLERLSGSISTQKRFLADAAHQLKTPLAGLRMQAELAQRELEHGPGTDLHGLAASVQQIARSTQRATHMVNQLLAMARAEDDTQTLRMQPVDLARLATEVVRDFVPRAMEARIDLGYEGPEMMVDPSSLRSLPPRGAQPAWGGPAPAEVAPSPPHSPPSTDTLVQGHRLLLREMLTNLVDNALHYTQAGGSVTVRLVADPFGQVIVLQVEDTGPGVPAAERELIFQPFYRSLGTDVDGSGLGLAIVREITRQHGAELTVTDTRTPSPGTAETPGACFTVRFGSLQATALSAPSGAEPSA